MIEYTNTNAAANTGALTTWRIGDLNTGSATTSIIDNTYYPYGYPVPQTTFYWNYGYCNACAAHWFGSHTHGHHCATQEHDFMQAQAPHADLLFCRQCGETKPLKTTRRGK